MIVTNSRIDKISNVLHRKKAIWIKQVISEHYSYTLIKSIFVDYTTYYFLRIAPWHMLFWASLSFCCIFLFCIVYRCFRFYLHNFSWNQSGVLCPAIVSFLLWSIHCAAKYFFISIINNSIFKWWDFIFDWSSQWRILIGLNLWFEIYSVNDLLE